MTKKQEEGIRQERRGRILILAAFSPKAEKDSRTRRWTMPLAGLLTCSGAAGLPIRLRQTVAIGWQHFGGAYSCGNSPGFSPDSLFIHKHGTKGGAKVAIECGILDGKGCI